MALIAEYLIKQYGWYEGLAMAIDAAEGKCVYCTEPLLETRIGYSSIVMDHLLPKSLYEDFEWDTRNHVLSCASCNSMKGNWDPLLEGESAAEMLDSSKKILIERAKIELNKKIHDRQSEWEDICAKFTS